jgi:hypothetical protein
VLDLIWGITYPTWYGELVQTLFIWSQMQDLPVGVKAISQQEARENPGSLLK